MYYNNISILKRAKDNLAHITTKHVSWVCEEEFDADETQPISFLEPDSFAFMKYQKSLENYRFEFKTSQQAAPLICGITGQNIFLLEIANGIVKLFFESNNNRVNVFSDVLVSDGLWHRLEVKHSAFTLEVSSRHFFQFI